MILLKDEEIESLKEEYEKILQVEWHPTVFYLLDAVAKAQLKNAAEYLEKGLVMEHESELLSLLRRTKHWQALLEEIK